MNKKRLALIVATLKGGAGKTTVTDFAVTVSTASGLSTVVADVDDGNSGYMCRAGKAAAVAVPWTTTADEAKPWLDKHFKDEDVLIFDLGANLTASEPPVSGFLAEAVHLLITQGVRVVFWAVASPNSPGTGRLVRDMRDDYGAVGAVHVVQNNVDGSGAFPRSLATLGLTKIPMQHIDPGIQAARMQRVEPLINVLRNPTPEYSLAMTRYAQKVAAFGGQAAVKDIFGDSGLPELNRLAANALKVHFTVRNIRGAENETLQANARYSATFRALRTTNRGNADLILARTLEFLEAVDAYEALMRHA